MTTPNEKEIKLGDKVTDYISGLKGTAIAQCIYLNGCIQYEVQGSVVNGNMPNAQWIDVQRLNGSMVKHRKLRYDKKKLKEFKRLGGSSTPGGFSHPQE